MTNEISALTEIAADTIDTLAVTPAQMLHKAIAQRVFDRVGVMSAPARVAHDRVAASAYNVTRKGITRAAGAAAGALRTRSRTDVRSLSRSHGGRLAIGALNAIQGDRLAEHGNELAIHMAVRQDGADVELTRAALAAAFPSATSSVAVFVHGLGETEEWWVRGRRGGHRVHAARDFGSRLRADAGFTPVYIRYNTGLRVSQNGSQFSSLLESLVGAWPTSLERLVLIGHSMGGLVIRSACHLGTEAAHRWPASTRHIVTLGTPHHGAPLAKAVHAAAWALRALPETQPLAQILDTRSAGIRDLRFGALHEDDWSRDDFDTFEDRRRDVPLLARCNYTFITATITVNPRHPFGVLLGDLLVRTASAGGRSRRRVIPVARESVVHLGGLTHFNLLHHPQVYEVLRSSLTR